VSKGASPCLKVELKVKLTSRCPFNGQIGVRSPLSVSLEVEYGEENVANNSKSEDGYFEINLDKFHVCYLRKFTGSTLVSGTYAL